MLDLGLETAKSAVVTAVRFTKSSGVRIAVHSQVKFHTYVLAGHAARDVAKLANDLNVDLIIVGSSGHCVQYGRMIGSRAQKTLPQALAGVLVVR